MSPPNEFDPLLRKAMHKRRKERRFAAMQTAKRVCAQARLKRYLNARGLPNAKADPTLRHNRETPDE